MRLLIAILMLSGCGSEQHKPVLGDYWAISTLSQINGDCGLFALPLGSRRGELWTINKDEDEYTLTLTDEDKSSVLFTTSDDGYIFKNEVEGPVLDCVWYIRWITKLKYTDDTIEGTHTDTMTVSCAPNVCEEIWEVSGDRL